MKNTLFRKAIIVLILLLSLGNVSFAGDSLTISVSCTIPEIPGVNVPPFENKTIKTELNKVAPPQELKAQEETNKTKESTIIQEEEERITQLAEGKTAAVITQTIYSR